VVIGSSNTTDGFQLASQYVIDNRTATILSESYGQCEQSLGTSGNSTINALWQQGAAEGISIFGSAGDQGSAGCDNSDLYQYNPATTGLNVNGLTSSPYITAVGGTDFNWQTSPISTYWNSTNAANDSTALGYIPEIPWNATCTSPYLVTYFGAANAEANCNTLAASTGSSNLVYITGGAGGVSACTTVSKAGACSGGYAKPSWQAGTGVPADGKRDVPDVSLFAGSGIPSGIPGSSYLICYSGSYPCSYGTAADVVFQEIGGTSVSAPAMAGIMALVQQKVGAPQGLANPVLYQLAAAESNLSACNTNTVTSGNGCVFYDTTTGTNAMACKSGSTNCVVNTKGDTMGVLSGYSATTGYDQATGLGSINAANLVNAWAAVPTPTISFSIPNRTYSTTTFTVSATSNSSGAFSYSIVSGPVTISGTTVTMTGAGTATVRLYQASAGGYAAGSATATFTISPLTSSVSWSPSSTTLFGGAALGTGILDAKGSVAGTIVYTATLGSGTPVTVTSTSTLANVGVYALTATLTPTSSTYSSSTATINLTVTSAYIWAINPAGSISEFYGNAAVTTSAVSGGGVGAAVDSGGNLWTINAGGNSVAEFNSNAAIVQSGITGGGISGATGLAIDGSGAIWLVNGNNSVSVVSSGATISPSTGYTGGNLSSPGGVAVDISGNVWISNTGNNSVTEILGAAAPVSPPATAVKNNTLGARP
jgi:subtilase family serine protease